MISRVLRAAAGMAVMIVPSHATAQDPRPLVVILAGQSNMVGQGVTDELTDEQVKLSANVTYLLSSGETSPSEHPRFGPEITLGQELTRAMPARRIVLIKHALGGTSLLAWAPAWDSTRAAITGNAGAGPLYRQLLDMVRNAGITQDAELGAVLWMQGERDARIAEAGSEYFDNLERLIAAFRRDLDAPDLPFLMGLVNPPAGSYPARQTVRDAQRRASREIANVYLVETDDLTKWDDDLHYNSEGIRELGRRFAAVFLQTRTSPGPHLRNEE